MKRNLATMLCSCTLVWILGCANGAAPAPLASPAESATLAASEGNRGKSKQLYDRAMAAANGGDFDTARPLFEQSLAADPNNFLAAFDLGGLHEALHDKDLALEHYQRAAKINPRFIEAHNQAATLLLLHKREHKPALSHWKTALLTDEPFVDARFSVEQTRAQSLRNLAVLYATDGRWGVAQGIARSALRHPQIERGSDRELTILIERTTQDMRSAAVRKHSVKLSALSQALYGKGSKPQVLADYLAFEKSHPVADLAVLDRWDLLSGIAMSYAMLHNNDQAAKYFEGATVAAKGLDHAKLVESHFNLACALSLHGEIERSLVEVEQVLWLEFLTQYDPTIASARRKAAKLSTDETLAKVRKDPRFAGLLGRYRPR